jgi:hypothetical protein
LGRSAGEGADLAEGTGAGGLAQHGGGRCGGTRLRRKESHCWLGVDIASAESSYDRPCSNYGDVDRLGIFQAPQPAI